MTPLATYDLAWREVHRLAPLAHSGRLPEMRFAGEAPEAMRALEQGAVTARYTCLAMSGVDVR